MNEFLGCGYDAAVSNLFYPSPGGLKLSRDSTAEQILSPLDELSVYRTMYILLPELWTLWELLLVGETVMVYSQTPSQASSVVVSLLSLILPLRYGGEWRPYFTIHDSDFKRFTSNSVHARGNCVVGVTNPFFLREFKDWPNKLILAADSMVPEELFDSALYESDVAKRQRSVSSTVVATAHAPFSGNLGGGAVDSIRKQFSRPSVVSAGASSLETTHRCAMKLSSKSLLEELIPLKVCGLLFFFHVDY